MSHTAEIIAVGTELLLGNITNTNASEISRALSAVGVNVFWHTVVGDNPERLREALDIARKRADVILTTGGLGPTYDDLTKQTVCETFGKPLVLREDVLEHIRTYFARNVHLTMPKNNRQQAEFPADCVIFDNSVGTAPGCAFEAEGVHVLMLPGPPFEMRTMLQNWAVPYLRGLSKEVIVSHDIMTFGLGESPMEDLMRETSESRPHSTSSSSQYVLNAIKYIQFNYSHDISIDDVAKSVGVSRSHLYRVFMLNVGKSPIDYLTEYRVNEACKLLRSGTLSIAEVAASVGFLDQFYFSRVFKRAKGVPPSKYMTSQADADVQPAPDET